MFLYSCAQCERVYHCRSADVFKQMFSLRMLLQHCPRCSGAILGGVTPLMVAAGPGQRCAGVFGRSSTIRRLCLGYITSLAVSYSGLSS